MGDIYVVTKGDYSDYEVVSIFDNEDKAQEFCNRYNENAEYYKAEVEIYKLNYMGNQAHKHLYAYQFTMERNGDTSKPRWRYNHQRETEIEIYTPSNGVYRLWCNVWAKDAEHAVKIANERRTQMIANGEWRKAEEED